MGGRIGCLLAGGAGLKGFAEAAIASSKIPNGPVIYGWWVEFLRDVVVPGHDWIAKLVALSEFCVGAALILGLFTGITAFVGLCLNFTYVFSGSVSSNPVFIILGVALVLAWRNAGLIGADAYLLPKLGTPWQTGSPLSALMPRFPRRRKEAASDNWPSLIAAALRGPPFPACPRGKPAEWFLSTRATGEGASGRAVLAPSRNPFGLRRCNDIQQRRRFQQTPQFSQFRAHRRWRHPHEVEWRGKPGKDCVLERRKVVSIVVRNDRHTEVLTHPGRIAEFLMQHSRSPLARCPTQIRPCSQVLPMHCLELLRPNRRQTMSAPPRRRYSRWSVTRPLRARRRTMPPPPRLHAALPPPLREGGSSSL